MSHKILVNREQVKISKLETFSPYPFGSGYNYDTAVYDNSKRKIEEFFSPKSYATGEYPIYFKEPEKEENPWNEDEIEMIKSYNNNPDDYIKFKKDSLGDYLILCKLETTENNICTEEYFNHTIREYPQAYGWVGKQDKVEKLNTRMGIAYFADEIVFLQMGKIAEEADYFNACGFWDWNF